MLLRGDLRVQGPGQDLFQFMPLVTFQPWPLTWEVFGMMPDGEEMVNTRGFFSPFYFLPCSDFRPLQGIALWPEGLGR